MMTTAARVAFRAMGTDVELVAPNEPPQTTVEALKHWFEYVESHLSRFRPQSELSMLNASAGRPFIASDILAEVLRGALQSAARTGGIFDPTVLTNLQAAGYRTSFDELGAVVESQPPEVLPRWDSIDITDGHVIVLPEGVGIDLGGYAKGWTVDRAARLLPEYEPWLLNAGGDIRASGAGPDGEGWLIGVEDPFALRTDLLVLRTWGGAVATSTTMRRRWMTSDGKFFHHLIDPRTGLPGQSDLASVTVIGESVAEAEVQAKVLLLLGRQAAVERAGRTIGRPDREHRPRNDCEVQ